MRFKDKKDAEKYVDDLEYGEFESYEDTQDIADFYGVKMSDDFYAAYNVVENVYGDIIFEEYDKVRAAENYRKMRMDPDLQRKNPPKQEQTDNEKPDTENKKEKEES